MRIASLLLAALCVAGCESSPASLVPDEIRNDATHLDSRDRPAFLAELDRRAQTGDVEARAIRILHLPPAERADRAILAELEYLVGEGSALAAHLLANAYVRGHGVEPDIDSAAVWLRRAQALGDTTVADELAAYAANQAQR